MQLARHPLEEDAGLISKIRRLYRSSHFKRLVELPAVVHLVIGLSLIIILAAAEYFAIINVVKAPTLPYNLDYLISIGQGISYIVLTGFLVLLYRRQADISESQKQVQESQLELSQYEHAPELNIKLLGGDMWALDPHLEFELANEGNGLIRGFWASTDLELKGKNPPDHLSGTSTFVNAAIPADSTPSDSIDFPQKIGPGESENQKIQFRLAVKDDKNQETVSGTGPNVLAALAEMGVNSVYIRVAIGARDLFGKEQNPITGPYRKFYSMHIYIGEDKDGVLNQVQSYINGNSSPSN